MNQEQYRGLIEQLAVISDRVDNLHDLIETGIGSMLVGFVLLALFYGHKGKQ